MKKFEGVELTQGNTTGKAGVGSLPFNRGYYTSGNDGSCGIQFTPNGEKRFGSYKSMKHSKKNIRRKVKKFQNFVKENQITEDCATLGNSNGMSTPGGNTNIGSMVSAQPSSDPGKVGTNMTPGAPGGIGTGEVSNRKKTFGPYTKFNTKKKKNKITSFKNFKP